MRTVSQGTLLDFTHYSEKIQKSKPYVFPFFGETCPREQKIFNYFNEKAKNSQKNPCQPEKKAV